MLALTRGVPDGKSEKSVVQSIDEIEDGNKHSYSNKTHEAKEIVLGNKVDLCTPGKLSVLKIFQLEALKKSCISE